LVIVAPLGGERVVKGGTQVESPTFEVGIAVAVAYLVDELLVGVPLLGELLPLPVQLGVERPQVVAQRDELVAPVLRQGALLGEAPLARRVPPRSLRALRLQLLHPKSPTPLLRSLPNSSLLSILKNRQKQP